MGDFDVPYSVSRLGSTSESQGGRGKSATGSSVKVHYNVTKELLKIGDFRSCELYLLCCPALSPQRAGGSKAEGVLVESESPVSPHFPFLVPTWVLKV